MRAELQYTWKSATVLALCKRGGYSDPIEGIKRNALELIQRSGFSAPPFSPFAMGGLLGVTKVSFTSIGFDACLIPVDGAFEVHIRNDHPKSRQNFSMAHELGHLFLIQATGTPNTARRESNIGSNRVDQEEEYLCDVAASELILPSPFFDESVYEVGPSLAGLLELATLYKASLEATARKFVASNTWRCCFLIWRLRHDDEIPKLGLEAVIASPCSPFSSVLKNEVSLVDESVVLSALKPKTIIRNHAWLRLRDVEVRYYMETMYIGSARCPRFLSMVVTEPGAGLWCRRRMRREPQLHLFVR